MTSRDTNRGSARSVGLVDARALLRIGFIMCGGYFVVEFVASRYMADLATSFVWVAKPAAMLTLWAAVVLPIQRASHAAANLATFERQLTRAFDMAQTEEDCYRLTDAAFQSVAPGEVLQLLLTDSSESHLRQVLPGQSEEPACGVRSPEGCPAVRGAQPMHFDDVDAIDLCPHLRALEQPATASCTPVSMLGRAAGVVHHHGVIQQIDSAVLDSTARLIGARVSMIRALVSSALQASTDPLTGLLNRRSLEQQANAILAARTETTVALVDLDWFKRLNDTHGHAAGDRALASFARLLQGSVRKTDLVSRYGGEEFVIVLPQQNLGDADRLFERLRSDLVSLNERTGLPPFTFSAGIAHSAASHSLVDLLALADRALMRAKNQGRDQTVRADEQDRLPARDVLTP